MIDIETMSCSSNASIITIAAVKFNRNDNIKPLVDMKTFYVKITHESCKKLKLHFDKETEKWWKTQTKETQKEIFDEEGRIDLQIALIQLSDFIGESSHIWANSPNFDCVILENAYNKCKIKIPWVYYKLRDTRTIYDIASINLKCFSSSNQKHNALHDCYSQINALKKSISDLSKGF